MPAIARDFRLELRQRPERPPVMYQSWRRLLFLHWKFEPEFIQKLLPAGLTVDTFDGSAWVGVVPFYMRNIRPCWSPVVPYISNFLEVNLRTYAVNDAGVPGVWFLTLDTNRLLAACVGRSWFKLPYHWAAMSARETREGWIEFRSQRFFAPAHWSTRLVYRPGGEVFQAQPETLEFFLAERYILFSRQADGTLATGQVYHAPYPLQSAEVKDFDDHVLRLSGLSAPMPQFDHALYSAGVDVEVFGLQRHVRQVSRVGRNPA